MTPEQQIVELKAVNARLEAENEQYKKHFLWCDNQIAEHRRVIEAQRVKIKADDLQIATIGKRLDKLEAKWADWTSAEQIMNEMLLEGCEVESTS